jgi:signal transduction histidine kinase
VRVTIEQRGGEVCFVVADDGRGFDAARPEADLDGHFGLAFMRERMLQVGGSVEIDSLPDAGTSVRLVVPARQGLGGEG